MVISRVNFDLSARLYAIIILLMNYVDFPSDIIGFVCNNAICNDVKARFRIQYRIIFPWSRL